jgi:hypothetical protein
MRNIWKFLNSTSWDKNIIKVSLHIYDIIEGIWEAMILNIFFLFKISLSLQYSIQLLSLLPDNFFLQSIEKFYDI